MYVCFNMSPSLLKFCSGIFIALKYDVRVLVIYCFISQPNNWRRLTEIIYCFKQCFFCIDSLFSLHDFWLVQIINPFCPETSTTISNLGLVKIITTFSWPLFYPLIYQSAIHNISNIPNLNLNPIDFLSSLF